MSKCLRSALLMAAGFSASLFSSNLAVDAKVSEQEAKKLDSSLTPMGAEKAGGADGRIPAWTGGITKAPPGYTKGGYHVDPYKEDKPLYTITAENASKHQARLSPGQRAMLDRYPNSWALKVYPTRRSAAYPEEVYKALKENARTAELNESGNGVRNARLTSPFPIPKNGLEAIWNHILRYRGSSTERLVVQVAPTASGQYSEVLIDDKIYFSYAQPGASVENINNRFAYFLQEVTAPARLAGTILLVHETLDQAKEPRNAWTYNPGQRRVRRAPNVAFDNPGTASDGQRTSDQLDMFNGSPERYDWNLVGKKEMYMPYNNYRLNSNELNVSDIVKPGHLNPEHLRYELRRVWVVDATLKSGTSHIYKRRTFYIDEDSWQILLVDQYDNRDQIWRVSEAYPINFYEMPLIWDTVHAHYDLQNGRYLAFGINNKTSPFKFNLNFSEADFSQNALRQAGRR